jgi:phosphoribosylformylglycinamidine synthase
LPVVDYGLHSRVLALLVAILGRADGLVDGVHDVSEGGLGVALAEMAVQSGTGTGFWVTGIADHVALFGEGPSRVVLSVPAAALGEVFALAQTAGVGTVVLGQAGGKRLVVDGLLDVSLDDAVTAWRQALPDALGVA